MNTDALKKLWKTVFADPDPFIDAFFDTAYSPDRCRYVMDGGEAVCALYWLDCSYPEGKLAYIYAVATHPDHRGKGLASELLRQTHSQLKAQGYAGAVLKPSEGLFPFYERLGYAPSGYIRHFYAKAGPVPAELKALSAREYGLLRRQLLPENAVVQEGEILTLLQTFSAFYRADNALVCVYPTEGVIGEYLGDPAAAPGILSALGIPQAHIPTTGDEMPFTMFLPLNCTKAPGYLGLSLE